MKRILIIGCSGAGKSTLASELGAGLGLPVYHLDKLFWRPGWVEAPLEEFDAKLAELLKTECWIMDGNYNRTLPERLKYADTVIFLRYSRWICLWRVLKRRIKYHGCTRADITDGCPERLDREFLRYIWNYNRDMLPRVNAAIAGSNAKILVFRTPREMEDYLRANASSVAR